MDEDDIAMYVLMTVDDPRTLNKTVYLRPPQNILSQKEVVAIWEGLIGKQLEKTFLSDQELLGMMNSMCLYSFSFGYSTLNFIWALCKSWETLGFGCRV